MATQPADSLHFRVLGALEVCRDGQRLALGGERQRALLALLLIHGNELVATEQLIDLLFGDNASTGAVKALQVAISRLRRALGGPDPGAVLQSRPGGYLLRVEPGQLDAAVFERRLQEGRRLVLAGDAASGAACLRDALGLWRGAPLADLALVEYLQIGIRRWQELRLLGIIERIDADLALGAGAELIAELETLITAEPLQERLCGQLMLALYRAGRQTDALAAYRETSELLRNELGLEPSQALQQLERSILRHDAALDPVPRPLPAPGNLPLPATAFLGRARELADVTALLSRADLRLLTLTGAGGSGKTRLALRLAQVAAPDHSDGAWFVGFAEITDPELIVPTICQTLGLAEQPDITPTERLQGWLRSRSLLLLLDNLEQIVGGTAVLGELLAGCPQIRLLVTSREPLRLAGEQQYEVPVLEPADAIELFMARAHAIAPRRNVESELARHICERLARLPLAIELAAARTKTLSPAEILERLDGSLALLTGGPRDAPRRQRALRATIDWSYELLDSDEQRLFARLAVFAGSCTLAAAESVCQAELDTLQSLVDRSLIRSEGGRYWMLRTLREYALERLAQTGDDVQLRHAHAAWLIDLLDAEGLAQPGWPNERSLMRVAAERENLRGALEWASSAVMIETVARLASPLVGVWVKTGQLYEAQRWITLVLEHQHAYDGLLAAQVVSAARALSWNRGDHVEAAALTERALALWREVGDLEAIGREMVSVGMVACEAEDFARGRAAFKQAVQFAREHALPDVLAVALIDLADLAILEGDLDAGQLLCEESRTVAAPGSDSDVIARINLAHIAMLEGRAADAAGLGRETLESALRAGSVLIVAWSTILVAWPLAALGELERSARLLGSGLEFLGRAGAKREWMDDVAEAAVCKILRAQLDEQTVQALLAKGREVPLEEAAREALDESRALAHA